MSEWTVDTLKEYFDALMAANTKAVEAALAAAQAAVGKAEIATEKRYDGLNELRGTMADKDKLLLPRTEFQAEMNPLLERLADLQTRVTKAEGRSGLSTPLLAALAGLAGAFLTYVLVPH